MTGITSRLRTTVRACLVGLTVVGMMAALSPIPASAAAAAANIDQCVNGGVSPLVLSPCLNGTLGGTGYSDWVNGNSNGAKSHWREGDFISYRATLTGLTTGSHTLIFDYQTVHGGKHAIDYVGSYDATETTSPTATPFNRNDSNPCFDILGTGGGQCTAPGTPPTPASTIAVPAATLTNCAGSAGGPITQQPGSFKAFGPAGTTLSAPTYVTQNVVSGTGQCDTAMSITVTEPTAGATIVIAWGGHIANQLDWGAGNSASFINGSPFHMSLVSLDGASTGSQDRALATSAVFFTPGIQTTVFDAATNAAWSGTELAGASAYDTANLTGDFNPGFGGSVTYYFFKPGQTCNNTAVTSAALLETDNITTAGTLPHSSTQSNLAPGAYAFQATYNGDSSGDLGWPTNAAALSACEPFMVGKATAALATTPSATSIVLGTTAPTLKDSATLTGGVSPTGTITFTLVAPNGTTVLDTETVTVTGDGTYTTPSGFTLPTSGAVTGTYQWHASYSGDGSNNPISRESNPGAEQVVVSRASPALTTTPGPTVMLGSGVKLTDTAHLSGGYFPTGTITFTLSGPMPGTTVVDTETVTVNGNGDYTTPVGFLPTSAGTYQWNATYSGDSNNNTVSDNSAANEQEVVSPNTPTLTTSPTQGSVTLGTSTVTLKDTAVLAGGTAPTGTITFKLTGPGSTTLDTETVTVTGDGSYTTPIGYTLPGSATVVGTYQWDASYSGDTNNNPITRESNPSAEQVVVSPATPGLVTTPAPTSVTLGLSSVNLKDSAVLSGAYNATGTITFTLVSPTSATVDTETVTVSGNGTYTTPTGYTLPTSGGVTGTYQWNATYSGDGNNASVSEISNAAERVTVSPASPALSTTPGATVVLGSGDKMTDTAHLSGGYNPTGTITFTLTGPLPGTAVVDTETVTVAGNGDYTTPTGYLPAAAGTYQWHASYSGDANNSAVTQENNSANEQEVVSPNTPTLSTSPTPSAVTLDPSTVTLKDTATLVGGTSPTGHITFTLVAPDGTTVLDTEIVTVSGDGSYTTPTGYTLSTSSTVVGTYQWNATYSGDTNNNPVTDNNNADERVPVTPASPALVTTPSTTSVTLGTSTVVLKDAAVLSGGYFATGTITFTLYQGSTLVDTETVPVSGNGTYTTPTGYTLPTTGTVTGTYQWDASYSGDSNNNAAVDNNQANERVSVTPANPTIVTTPDPTSVTLGTTSPTLRDSAVLSGGYNATGSITFTLLLGTTTVDTETVTVSGNGTYTTPVGYTLPGTGAVTGTYQWNATYSGDGNNNPASDIGDAGEQVVVSPASPVLVTTPSPTSVVLSTTTVTLNDSAVLSGGYFATGHITFTLMLGATTVDTETVSVSGNGTYTTPTGYTTPSSGPVTGTYQWNATYSGDSNNSAASDNGDVNERVTVAPASPALTTTPGPTLVLGDGHKLSDTAHLTGGYFPTGTITFTLYLGTTLVHTETVPVAGNGDYATVAGYLPLHAGTYQWDASYSGDANNNAIAQEGNPTDEQEVVSPSSPTLITSPDPTAVTLGTTPVVLKDTAALAGGTLPSGTITFTLQDPSHTVVDTEVVTVSGNGSYTTPTGYTLPANSAVTGTYQWNATYSGDSDNQPISEIGNAAEQVSVSPANPTITTVPDPSSVTLGTGSVTLKDAADLEGGYSPTGTITFTLYHGAVLVDTETATVNGDGTYSTPTGYTLPTSAAVTGTYQWDASYSGDANNNAAADNANANEQVNVSPASPALVTTPSPASVTLGTSSVTLKDSAVLSGGYNPTGSIVFTLYQGTTLLDTESVAVTGNGTYTTPAGFTLPSVGTVTGTYQWDATYSGDANNNTVSENNSTDEQVAVGPASPTISTVPSPTSVTLGTSTVTLKDTADLEGGYSPTGTITFTLYHGATLVDTETVSVNGNGFYTTPAGYTLPSSGTVTGTYQWNASYSGDSNNNGVADNNDASEQVTVSPAGPAIVTTPSPTSVTLGTTSPVLKDSATLSGGYNPTGMITFTLYHGTTPVDTELASVSGNGTYTTLTGYTLPATGTVTGTYQWDAVYSGDTNNATASDINALNEQVTVGPASPSLVTTPNPTTVTLGTSVVTLKDSAVLSGGYNPTGTITFTLIGPSSATVDTETVAVNGNGTYSTPNGYITPTSGAVAGLYQWNATYSGDTNNNFASEIGNAAEQVTITPASPTLVTTPNPGTVTLGTSTVTLKDSAVLSGGYFPTGTITFRLLAPDGTTLLDTEVVAVSGNGTYSTPTGFTTLSSGAVTGTYQWNATYSGDGNNNGTSEIGNAAEQVNVSPASPSLNTTPNPSTAGIGSTLKDTATLSGGYFPTGAITFTLYDPSNNVVDTETVTVNGNGVYSTPVGATATAGGTYQWVASYSGDANNKAAASTKGSEPVAITQVSQITPTQTTCAQFAGGTAATLSTFNYSTKGSTISNVNPGVMFYWVKVNVTGSGSHTYTISQTSTYKALFAVASGSFAYDSSCNTLGTTLGTSNANLTVTFSGGPGVYYIGIKYSPKSIVGTGPATTAPGSSYTYTFQTSLGGSPVAGSISTAKLIHQ